MRELLHRIDSKEISEWIAYSRMQNDPGPQDQDVAVANAKAVFGGG